MHRTHQKLWITPSRWTDYGVALGEGHLLSGPTVVRALLRNQVRASCF